MNISYCAAHASEYCQANNIYVAKPTTFNVSAGPYWVGTNTQTDNCAAQQVIENVGWHWARFVSAQNRLYVNGTQIYSNSADIDISSCDSITIRAVYVSTSYDGEYAWPGGSVYLY